MRATSLQGFGYGDVVHLLSRAIKLFIMTPNSQFMTYKKIPIYL
ncbi:MAG: hypothetical protein O4965_29150 [Trichodesmium sp. St19_bin1]|nr:hypothetical protein [Trichodesmium sp. St19_bin1]